jgi:hypothetical protein
MPVAPFTPPPQGQQAPPPPEHNGNAYYLKISAQQDGTFTVTNTRNGFSKPMHQQNLELQSFPSPQDFSLALFGLSTVERPTVVN